MSPPPPLLLVVGPTGVGKTALGIALAELLGGEVLSCDSVQVYRGMDIGSAKASREEQSRVRHHGIDLADPWQPFDVEQFIAHARPIVEAARRPLLAVGGSGFYLKAFHGPVTDGVRISAKTREFAAQLLADGGLAGLLRELDRRCGTAISPMDRQNPRRVLRALERCVETGRTAEELRRNFRKLEGPFARQRKFTVLLRRDRRELDLLLRQRTERMLREGLIDEVRELRRRNFECNPSASGAVCYREVLDYLDGRIGRNELPERIHGHNRRLVRKQETWFRHQIPIDVTLPPGPETPAILLDLLRRRGDFPC
jgi:tRNA dimethylallyltransferase